MFNRKYKIVTVPESEYTDFSHRDPSLSQFATTKTVAAAAVIPAAVSIGLLIKRLSETNNATSIPIPVFAPVIEPVNVLAQTPTLLPVNMTAIATPLPSNTGVIADKSLEMLATALDPLIQIMLAISFPIASVIIIGACFMFMFNNSEKGWDMIMKAGLGYCLIQLSPLFLEILRQVGKAI